MKSFIHMALVFGSISLSYGYDFFRYSPSPRTINDVSYPRNNLTAYRGTTDGQMDINRAVRAMFRDPTANLESFFFTTIKSKLMGKSFGAEVTLSQYLITEIQKEISYYGGPLDEKKAVEKAIELSDNTFEHNGDSKNIAQFVNYLSNEWIDWPKNVVFSTIVSPVAATYGDRVVVINEKTPRAIDLNFWNLVDNGKPPYHDRDIGEFSTPGYIAYSDIDGYQIRTSIRGSIVYSFHRLEIAGKSYILVMDGTWDGSTYSKCIVQVGKYKIVHCNYPGGIAVSPPPATDKEVAILGVVALCDSKANCDLPREIYQNITKVSAKKLSSSVQDQIEAVKVKGKKAFYFQAQ